MNTYGATKTNLSALIHNAESLFLTFKAMISIFTIPEACTMQILYILCVLCMNVCVVANVPGISLCFIHCVLSAETAGVSSYVTLRGTPCSAISFRRAH